VLIVAAILAAFLVDISDRVSWQACGRISVRHRGVIALAALYLIPTFVVALAHIVVLGLPLAARLPRKAVDGMDAPLVGASLLAQFPWAFCVGCDVLKDGRVSQGVPDIIDSVAIRLDDLRWVGIAGSFGVVQR